MARATRTRWNAGAILETGRAFWECRVLLTAAELDLFTQLSRSARTAEQLATSNGFDLDALTMLLDALAAMGLLKKSGHAYRTTPSTVDALDARSEVTVLPMLRHMASIWKAWDRLTDIVRHGKPKKGAPQRRSDAELESFICAMHVIGRHMAEGLMQQIMRLGGERLLDVGGGPASYTAAFLRARPDARATLFDLPPVIEIARRQLRKAGLVKRVSLVPGDFYQDPLPAGHDVVLLSAIIHQNSRAQNVALYRKIREALVPGGRIVIRDHVMDRSRTRPRAGALFAINMLVATPAGGTYTLPEIRADLRAAGFRKVEQVRSGEMMDSLVTAVRP